MTDDQYAFLRQQIEDLRRQFEELRNAGHLRARVDDALQSSPLYRGGKWVLFTVLIVTVTVTLGGTIYSGIRIASVQSRFDRTIAMLEKSENTALAAISHKEQSILEKFELRTGDVADLGRQMNALKLATNTAQNDLISLRNDLGNSRINVKEVKEKLSDIRNIEQQTEQLQERIKKIQVSLDAADPENLKESIGDILSAGGQLERVQELRKQLTKLDAAVVNFSKSIPRLRCDTDNATSNKVRNPSIEAVVPKELQETYVVTGGGCQVPGFFGHNPPIVRSSPTGIGWICEGNDPPNIPLEFVVQAHVVYCTVER